MIKSEDIVKIENNIYNRRFVVRWQLTLWCNYRCPGCIQKHDVKTYPWRPQSEIDALVDNFNDLMDDYVMPYCREHHYKTELRIVGGEISYYDLIDFFSQINLRNFDHMMIMTNFSNNIKYYIDVANYVKRHNVRLTYNISYHPPAGDADAFVQKLLKLHDYGIRFKTDTFVTEETFNERFVQLMIENNLKLSLDRMKLTGTKEAVELSPEHMELVRLMNSRFVADEQSAGVMVTFKDDTVQKYRSLTTLADEIENGFDSNGCYCSLGRNFLTINSRNQIFRTQCRAISRETKSVGLLNDKSTWQLDYLHNFNYIKCELAEGHYCGLVDKQSVYRSLDDIPPEYR